MLIQLKLKNVALIEIIEINFEKGLNILTGDSGSGKSLILDSINVLFGGTNIPLKHLIRPGKAECLIEAKFNSTPFVENWLSNYGFEIDLPQLVIRRKSYKKNNKILTKYSLNNFSISKKLLEELGLLLIDFAGQSDTFLFDSHEYRRSIIDDLGSKELKAINLKVKNTWRNYEDLKNLLQDKIELNKKKEEKTQVLKEMFRILDQANFNSVDEILDLESQQNKLAHNYEINNSIQAILKTLNSFCLEDPSIEKLISESIKYISKISEIDSKLKEFKDKLLSIQDDVENLIYELNTYIESVDNNEITLEDMQKRLFFLKNLERTFSLPLPKLIEKRDQLKKQLFFNENTREIKDLEIKIDKFEKELNSLFLVQSSQRKDIAMQLQNSVVRVLKSLGLENAKFLIQLEDVSPSAEGLDNINFLFSANPDQNLAPLSKIISGGEMSRFLLAIKSSISQKPNTLFLDEVDNGLSGKSLLSLVELIKTISKDKQVLCITHQPFLAAAGTTHFKVIKDVINGLTVTSIIQLTTKKERQNELTELIGGGFGGANDYASILLDRAAA